MHTRAGYPVSAPVYGAFWHGWRMQTLSRWWPVTYDFGLVRSDIDSVAAAWIRMNAGTTPTMSAAWFSEPLEDCFSMLLPLSPAPTKQLFIATRFGWTAFFQNGARGSDPFLPMHRLSGALGVTALRACVTRTGAVFPAVILEVYDTPQAGGDEHGYRRSIAAANDGGRWVFQQSGAPFAFEDTARYSVRRKRDRFTPDMLHTYLECLGIPRLSDTALQSDGLSRALLSTRPDHHHLPQYSLEEAKAL